MKLIVWVNSRCSQTLADGGMLGGVWKFVEASSCIYDNSAVGCSLCFGALFILILIQSKSWCIVYVFSFGQVFEYDPMCRRRLFVCTSECHCKIHGQFEKIWTDGGGVKDVADSSALNLFALYIPGYKWHSMKGESKMCMHEDVEYQVGAFRGWRKGRPWPWCSDWDRSNPSLHCALAWKQMGLRVFVFIWDIWIMLRLEQMSVLQLKAHKPRWNG